MALPQQPVPAGMESRVTPSRRLGTAYGTSVHRWGRRALNWALLESLVDWYRERRAWDYT
jgi:hypothetical protein